MQADLDAAVRVAAFQWLRSQVVLHGDVLPRTTLAAGFDHQGRRVPLIGPQGIFKPAVCRLPISITTSPNSPYADRWGADHLEYAYRGTDPAHLDNVGLRTAMREQVPLVYFHGIAPGRYLAAWPVYIVGDEPGRLMFRVAFDDQARGLDRSPTPEFAAVADASPIRRAYITATVRRRLHQEAFRDRVLRAYTERCALCRLRHRQLLDAAHIDPDAAEHGDPVVSNGIALCKLHHAAFDAFFITVRPDYRVEVHESILSEEDGPMLLHGLKALHGENIALPHDIGLRPDRDRLEHRYDLFRRS